MATDRLTSADGTELAVRVTGHGPPMVLVHGGAGTKDVWALVAPALGTEFTVWSYDRRGRGGSSDASAYDFGREIDDVLAVVGEAGGADPVVLVGHSFGACCALEAAARRPEWVQALVLYEPPFHVGRAEDAIRRGNELLASGRTEEAVETFLTGVAAVTSEELALIRAASPTGRLGGDTAHTVSREIAALAELGWDPSRYANVGMPTLLIWGALTGSAVFLGLDELRSAVSHADGIALDDQRHLAIATGPELFARTVLAHARRARSPEAEK